MKFLPAFLSFLFFISSLTSCAQKKLVSKKIEYTEPYCGGARPTPEMEEEAEKPKPYAAKTIIFINESGKIDSAKTDANGVFKKKLSYGKYNVFESWKYYKKTLNGTPIGSFDKNCIESEWKKQFMTINCSKKSVNIESKEPIILYCDYNTPCILEKHMPPKRQ